MKLLQGNCLDAMREMPDNSVDAIVTDPPYGLSFMGKKWDYDVPSVDIWREALRVLKPGGHLLAFAGTRTQHRMAVNIEDAGFEIRDMIAWVYGSGFPKSLDVSKAIDKAAGAEREVVGPNTSRHGGGTGSLHGGGIKADTGNITAPATEAARKWSGWGTALKPALEPITVARKPFKGTVAANVLEHGTGALNVDGCRVGTEMIKHQQDQKSFQKWKEQDGRKPKQVENPEPTFHQGRWPANLIHDGSDEPVDLLGDAARFFYCAKASKADRDEGCEGLELRRSGAIEARNRESGKGQFEGPVPMGRNHHPTVKPTALMRYLCRLITPPGGVILDPFMGSGSTGKAAAIEGFQFIGIEMDAEYLAIANARITAAKPLIA